MGECLIFGVYNIWSVRHWECPTFGVSVMDPKHLPLIFSIIFLPLYPAISSETGLLVVGGEGGLQSVEFWTPPPLSAQCFLGDLPHWNFFHSLDSLNGEVICGDSSCSRLEAGKWEAV